MAQVLRINDDTIADFSSNQTLNEIAHENSVIGGPAVFTARSLLGLIIPEPDWSEIGYRKEEWIKPKRNEEEKVLVYPNPNAGNFYFKIESAISVNDKYYLLDELGRVVLTGKVNRKLQQVNCSELTRGVYILRLSLSGKNISSKVTLIK